MKKQMLLCSVVGVLAGVNAFAVEGVKVGGFVDAQYQWNNVVNTGFRLGDAALRFAAEGKENGVKIALPLTFNAGTSTSIVAGSTQRAEAHIWNKYGNGFSWKLGQFESQFGVERNFSDMNWAAANTTSATAPFGLLKSAGYQPLTFMGLALGYKTGGFEASLLFADAHNTSIVGATGTFDFGVQLGYVTETMWAKAGFLYNSTAAVGYLIDVVAGAKMGSFKADVGFQMANPATISNLGIFVQPQFAFNDTIGAGVRFELLTAGGVSAIQATVGPDFTMSKELKVRPQYTFNSTGGVTGHGIVLSTVYSL